MVDQDRNEVTVIGETILVAGSLRGDENLTVLGRVEGEVNLSQTLLVAEGGVVKAEINVQNAVISGIVVGNVTATDCLHLTATGKVLGDLCAERLILDPGARVRGAVKVGARDRARNRERQEQALQADRSHSLPTSLMARRQLSQAAARTQALPQAGSAQGSPLPAAQEAVGGASAQQRAAQEAMAMAVKKKVAGKKRG